MIENIKIDFSNIYPTDLVDALFNSYIELKEHFYLNKHEPSELNGGKFVEATARLLEQELNGSYTPIGTPIRNMNVLLRSFENQPATYNDSLRIHIPRVLASIYNIRNRRGVGHLGGDVSANIADSTLIVSNANWVLAELYRMVYSCSLEEAQKVVDSLVSRKMILVHDLGEVKRVLATFLTFKEQTLLLLASIHPETITDKKLCDYTEHSNFSLYKSRILKSLHKERQIEYSGDGQVTLLPPGLIFVDNNYENWLSKINNGEQ